MKMNGPTGVLMWSVFALGSTFSAQAAERCSFLDRTVCPLDIQALPLNQALNAFAQQGGLQIVFGYQIAFKDQISPPLKGDFTPDGALQKLLSGTDLEYRIDEGYVTVWLGQPSTPTVTRTGSRDPQASPLPPDSGRPSRLPFEPPPKPGEVVVNGRRISYEQIRVDDIQPYIILDRSLIDSAGSTNVEEFIERQVTGATVAASTSDYRGLVDGNGIALHGFNPSDVLYFVEWRRLPNQNIGGVGIPSDINSIPLAAIERIEVVPTSATAKYGAGSEAGVVNLKLRRDFQGTEARLEYDTPYDGVTSVRRFFVSHGSHTLDGRSNILFFGSASDDAGLRMGDRHFMVRGRESILLANPNFYLDSPVVPLGATVNVRTLDAPIAGASGVYITHLPSGYRSTMGLDPLLANAGSYNLQLADSAQIGAARASMLNAVKRGSADIVLNHDFSDAVSVFLNVSGSMRRSSSDVSAWQYGEVTNALVGPDAPNNVFRQLILVSVPMTGGSGVFEADTDAYRLLTGLTSNLYGSWKMSLDISRTWTRITLSGPELQSLADQIYDGSLDVLVDTSKFPIDVTPYWRDWRTSPYHTDSREAALTVGGSPWGKSSKLSFMLQSLREASRGGEQWMDSGAGTVFESMGTPGVQSRSVKSARVQLNSPLFSRMNDIAERRLFEMEMAASYDSYVSHVTPSITPDADPNTAALRFITHLGAWAWMVGLRYRPMEDVTFRMTYSTGNRPPTMNETTPGRRKEFGERTPIWDPRRNEPATFVTVDAGGNPNLKAEESESTLLGAVYAPASVPGFSLSLDVTYMKKRNDIYTVGQTAFDDLLAYEAFCPECVVRDPATPGDPGGVGKIRHIVAQTVNASSMQTFFADAALDYNKSFGRFGSLDLKVRTTWVSYLKMQLTPLSEMKDYSGLTARHPLRSRSAANLKWTLGRWELGWNAQYFAGYAVSDDPEIIANQGGRRVGAQQQHDMYVNFALFKGAEFRFGVKDVFNSKPRMDAGEAETGYISPIGEPGLRTYQAGVRLAF